MTTETCPDCGSHEFTEDEDDRCCAKCGLIVNKTDEEPSLRVAYQLYGNPDVLPSAPLPNESTWRAGQRETAKQLGLNRLRPYFNKVCVKCGEEAGMGAHKDLCPKHYLEYRRAKKREYQANRRAREAKK